MYTQKINLMPQKDSGTSDGSKIGRYVIGAFVIIAVVALIAGALYYKKDNLVSEDKGLDADIASLDAEIKRNTESGIDDFRKRTDVLTRLLDNHLYWSRAFNLMESKALKNSKFQDFKAGLMEEDGVSVKFTVSTSNFYEAARQILIFQQLLASEQSANEQKKSPPAKSFKASGFKVRKEGGISFDASILLNKNFLYERE